MLTEHSVETVNDNQQVTDLVAENERLRKANLKWREAQAELYQKYEYERTKRLALESDDSRSKVEALKSLVQVNNVTIKDMEKRDDLQVKIITKLENRINTLEKDCEMFLNHARQFQAQLAEMKECQICNEPFDHDSHHPSKANCSHILYCKGCLLQVAENTGKCPACRFPFKKKDIERVNLSFI